MNAHGTDDLAGVLLGLVRLDTHMRHDGPVYSCQTETPQDILRPLMRPPKASIRCLALEKLSRKTDPSVLSFGVPWDWFSCDLL